MQRILVKDLVGQNAITPDDGARLFDLIHEALLQDVVIALDFDGVEVFASPFFNAGVARLLSDISPEKLNAHLKFEHISDFGSGVLHRVIDNAKEYYGSLAVQRQKIDQIVANSY